MTSVTPAINRMKVKITRVGGWETASDQIWKGTIKFNQRLAKPPCRNFWRYIAWLDILNRIANSPSRILRVSAPSADNSRDFTESFVGDHAFLNEVCTIETNKVVSLSVGQSRRTNSLNGYAGRR